MNGRERMALAMRHEIPDRVPVMCQLALGHYFLNTGLRPRDIWFTSEGFAGALVQLQQRYGFDGILVNLPGRPPGILDRAVSITGTPAGERIAWADGTVTFIPRDDNAQHRLADGTPLPRADFATIDPADLDFIEEMPGYVWSVYHVPWLLERTRPGPLAAVPPYFDRTIKLVREMTNGEVAVHGEVFSPLTHFMELFGYTEALLAMTSDPDKAHALLDRLTEPVIRWGVAQAILGVDAVLISSAFAGGPFLSRRMYREFVVPYERRVSEAIKAAGTVVYTHTCGRIGDRLDLMLETGTQGVDTLDPPPLGNANLDEAKAQLGSRAFIKGNMNAVELLEYESAERVIAHATNRIEIGKPGGGYILSTACSVAPRVEPWKLELLVPLAERIGRY